ncbi:MAG: hypothetical protein AB8G99_03535 [Planctomycetaceae bacterium]
MIPNPYEFTSTSVDAVAEVQRGRFWYGAVFGLFFSYSFAKFASLQVMSVEIPGEEPTWMFLDPAFFVRQVFAALLAVAAAAVSLTRIRRQWLLASGLLCIAVILGFMI